MKVDVKMRLISKTSCTVQPTSPAGQGRVMEMSGADQFVRPRHVPILLFYAAREDGQTVLPTQLMKDALSQLVVHFYPCAGRLRRRADGKLELVCNDAGVEFVEAEVSGRISDLGEFGPNLLYTQLLNPAPAVVGDAVLDYPITYIQVTRFACGGASLTFCGNHGYLDGLSANMFVNSLSEISRGKQLSLPPVHDRARLKATRKCDPSFQPTELRAISNLALALPMQDKALWPAERMFVFSPGQLKRIKSAAAAGEEGHAFTTFQAINGHIWRSITKARNLQPHTKTKFLTTLDARRRVRPSLPEGYFGNCICFVNAIATAGDVVNSPLSFAASCIREAIDGFTIEYMDSVLAFVEACSTPLVMNVNAGESAGHDVSCASWVHMGFMEADMGSGKPKFVTPCSNPFDGNILMLPSHKGQGYINVFVGLKRESMERLVADPEFLPEE